MIGNFDATQFIVSEKNNELLASVKRENDEPLTLAENSTLDQGVKWFMLCNAAGYIGKDAFLISDSSMDLNKFECYEIGGLSHSTVCGVTGYLCVARGLDAQMRIFQMVF